MSATIMRTTLPHSATISRTLFYGLSCDPLENSLTEFRADSDIWDVHHWASKKPTLNDIHWLAGLFEGEGSVSTRGIRIPQKERETLDRVRQLFGGRVTGHHLAMGGIIPPVPMFSWAAYGPRARTIIGAIFQLLSSRRQAQARDLLRISRHQSPSKPDPEEPAACLWDWGAPDPWDVE